MARRSLGVADQNDCSGPASSRRGASRGGAQGSGISAAEVEIEEQPYGVERTDVRGIWAEGEVMTG